ncbi:MAG: hypothetical protein M5R36_13705 [Deltaproteobacteria bacterium]|nr:hypothetical protein [Deltaproteobacteria bacterium]
MNGDVYTYTLTNCYSESYTPEPDEVRFNVTVDGFFHTLPACNVGDLNEQAGTYRLDDGDEPLYLYNSNCRDGQGVLNRKCAISESNIVLLDTGDVFLGVNAGAPSGTVCKQFQVIFDGIDPPDNFAAWVEWRYQVEDIGRVAVTGEIGCPNLGDDDDDDECAYGEITQACVRDKLIFGEGYPAYQINPDIEWIHLKVSDEEDIGTYVIDQYEEFGGMVSVPFADVEVLEQDTGDSYGTPITGTADAFGWVMLEDIPDDTVAIRAEANGYAATVEYFFPVPVQPDFGILLFPDDVVDDWYDEVSETRESGKATLFVLVEYASPDFETYESVGCAEASLDVAGDVYYVAPNIYDEWLPDPNRDPSDPIEDGEGTYHEEGETVSSFVAMNVTPGEVTVAIDADGEEEELVIPDVCADCFVNTYITYWTTSYASNPTGTWCTE